MPPVLPVLPPSPSPCLLDATRVLSSSSSAITKKVRVVDVVYNATNNELVRTKTLVKGSIIQVDAAPFRQWYESHYGKTIGRVRADYTPAAMKDTLTEEQLAARQAESTVESDIIDQFNTGRLYGTCAFPMSISSLSLSLVSHLRARGRPYVCTLSDPDSPSLSSLFLSPPRDMCTARISSRPGQVGRCDGYILEGAELDFYLRKLRK